MAHLLAGQPDIRHSVGMIKYVEEGQNKEFVLEIRVSGKWKKMGVRMGIELNILDNLEVDKHCQAERWQAVMQRWMEGQGGNAYPATWDGLYQLLKDIGVPKVALELKKAVDNSVLC